MDTEYEFVECDPVHIYVSTSQRPEVTTEKKIYRSMTVKQLKNRLEMLTGADPDKMHLELYDSQVGDNGVLLANLEEDAAYLDAYDVTTGCRLHILDDFVHHTKPVPRYSLTWEEYDRKSGTLRSYMRRNKIGKYDSEVQRRRRERRIAKIMEAEKRVSELGAGSKCIVDVPGKPLRKATVMYRGEVTGLRGKLIGVRYDGPLGKNDGSFAGRRYFTCPDLHGAFVDPCCVQLDKPEIRFQNDDEI